MNANTNDDGEDSVQSHNSESSDATITRNNASSPSSQSSSSNRRNVNQGLDGYTKTPSKHVCFCKAKIAVPESESPTKKMREALGKVLTTLLKIDTNMKLYEYKDKSTKKIINNPSQIPETPSKIKHTFTDDIDPIQKQWQCGLISK